MWETLTVKCSYQLDVQPGSPRQQVLCADPEEILPRRFHSNVPCKAQLIFQAQLPSINVPVKHKGFHFYRFLIQNMSPQTAQLSLFPSETSQARPQSLHFSQYSYLPSSLRTAQSALNNQRLFQPQIPNVSIIFPKIWLGRLQQYLTL